MLLRTRKNTDIVVYTACKTRAWWTRDTFFHRRSDVCFEFAFRQPLLLLLHYLHFKAHALRELSVRGLRVYRSSRKRHVSNGKKKIKNNVCIRFIWGYAKHRQKSNASRQRTRDFVLPSFEQNETVAIERRGRRTQQADTCRSTFFFFFRFRSNDRTECSHTFRSALTQPNYSRWNPIEPLGFVCACVVKYIL